MAGSGSLFIIDVDTGEQLGPIQGDKGDVSFPERVRGWSDVLDCRHEPYQEMPLPTLRHYAHHVHKFFLLVDEGYIASYVSASAAPPLEAAEPA
ncbi:MAG: hypothetical protein CMH57_14460 [Myxococcales bacterium]|nr:hypothetical protein [Myxococcales bacterium]